MSSKIKEKLTEHIELFSFTKETQRGYISGVRCMAKHYNQSPETLTDEQVRAYFHHLLTERTGFIDTKTRVKDPKRCSMQKRRKFIREFFLKVPLQQ